VGCDNGTSEDGALPVRVIGSCLGEGAEVAVATRFAAAVGAWLTARLKEADRERMALLLQKCP
jgi:hypothetical protein